MPRPHRIQLQDVAHHLMVRGNNKAAMFFGDADREFFLRCLHNGAASAGCEIHAYVLMTNHVHLMVSPRAPGALSRMMQDAGRRYVENVNLLHGRTGTLFEGRFKAKPILTMSYAMTTLRYVEQNPVRAGMVARIEDYRWSSARHHLGLHEDASIVEHAVFLALGETREERVASYARHWVGLLDPGSLAEARAAPKRGRPPKAGADETAPDDSRRRRPPAPGDHAGDQPSGA